MTLFDLQNEIDAFRRQSAETAQEWRSELASIKELIQGLLAQKQHSADHSSNNDLSNSSSRVSNKINGDPEPQSEVLYSISEVFDEVTDITMQSLLVPSITVEDECEIDSMVKSKVTIIDECLSDDGLLELVLHEHCAVGEKPVSYQNAISSNISCTQGVRQNVHEKLISYFLPPKPPDEYLNMVTLLNLNNKVHYDTCSENYTVLQLLNLNHTVQYGVRCSDLRLRTHHTLALPSVQENLIVPSTCTEIYLMELKVPYELWCLEEILWPPDATKFLVMCLKLITKRDDSHYDIDALLSHISAVGEGSPSHISDVGDSMNTYDEMKELISMYADLFKEPSDLPSFRTEFVHKIPLLERAKAVNKQQLLSIFFDDILIYHSRWKDNIQHLLAVFSILRDNQLFLKLSKCTFEVTVIKYLRHFISASGISTDSAKLTALTQWHVPSLTNLLKNEGFVWTSDGGIAFENLKLALANPFGVADCNTFGLLSHISVVGTDMCTNNALHDSIYTYADLFEEPSERTLGVTLIEYLGHFISAASVSADPAKLKDVNQWPVPLNQNCHLSTSWTYNLMQTMNLLYHGQDFLLTFLLLTLL